MNRWPVGCMLLVCACVAAEPDQEAMEVPEEGLAAITVEGLRAGIEVLAHDSLEGRAPGTAGEDKTIRVWQMPNLDQKPLHALPHEELIAKLQSLTNLHAVRDPASSTGWSIEIGPFPGWEEVPEW